MNATRKELILGTRKGLLILKPRRRGWQLETEAFAGISVSYAMRDPRTNVLWACLDTDHWGPKLQRSRDGGETWEEVPAPRYPSGAQVAENSPAKLNYLWVLAPGGANEPERLYAGTDPGGLFVSHDGGEHYELVTGLWNHPSRPGHWFGGGRNDPGIHSVIVDPRNHQRVLVGISCGGVFETTDGGENWQPRNSGLLATFLPDPHAEVGHDPHLLAMCAQAPDVLWQQNHCGVFRSEDGGRMWRDVSEKDGPAVFGFAIAADPDDPNRAWVVPAVSDELRLPVDRALCVSRTDDGGQSWTTFRRGLPQEGCYDLVYRHGLDLSGETLAFGTTTGNLFVSEDGGEGWICVGQHFPPIASVRFAA